MRVFETKVDVRYAETDQMGVVYHANYLIWFELGRSALLETMGLDYVQLEKEGYVSPVIKIDVSYKRPVRYGDEVTIKTRVKAYDGLRVTYAYEIFVGDRFCATGSSVHVCVRTKDSRPVSMGRNLPRWHEVYESLVQIGKD
ncbi:MAG TPA: hypothetical protein DDZ66_08635 [Firmicutes bacterium]|nr:hypothetical protein [Bacillota bacterium]